MGQLAGKGVMGRPGNRWVNNIDLKIRISGYQGNMDGKSPRKGAEEWLSLSRFWAVESSERVREKKNIIKCVSFSIFLETLPSLGAYLVLTKAKASTP